MFYVFTTLLNNKIGIKSFSTVNYYNYIIYFEKKNYVSDIKFHNILFEWSDSTCFSIFNLVTRSDWRANALLRHAFSASLLLSALICYVYAQRRQARHVINELKTIVDLVGLKLNKTLRKCQRASPCRDVQLVFRRVKQRSNENLHRTELSLDKNLKQAALKFVDYLNASHTTRWF